MIGHQEGHLVDPRVVCSLVQVHPLQLPPGVGAGPDLNHGFDKIVPGGTGDTLVPIPEAVQDHVAT